jgi:hypothetical protein
VRVEPKETIRNKRATGPGNPDRISCLHKDIHRQTCRRSPRRNSRVRRRPDGGCRWANQLLLKSVIIGRHDRKEESEDPHSAEQMDPTPTPRRSKVVQRPASESCQTHEQRTRIYTCPHAPKPRNNLFLGSFGSEKRLCLRHVACQATRRQMLETGDSELLGRANIPKTSQHRNQRHNCTDTRC